MARLDELAAIFDFDLGTPAVSVVPTPGAPAALGPGASCDPTAAADPRPQLLMLSEVMHRFVANEFELEGFETDPEDVVPRPMADVIAEWAETGGAGDGLEYSPSSAPVDDFFEVRGIWGSIPG